MNAFIAKPISKRAARSSEALHIKVVARLYKMALPQAGKQCRSQGIRGDVILMWGQASGIAVLDDVLEALLKGCGSDSS